MSSAAGTGRWNRVEKLFYEALDLEPDKRPAFLDQACSDDASLRQEVESLIESASKTFGFLQRPIEQAAQGVALRDLGQRIGPYQLMGLLGEGGMGEVYLAVRADQLYEQEVAIKLMRPGLKQAQAMLLRFSAERQILANLNHPNIARLLDAGITPEGAPYLVMEYVKGIPIDEYCRSNELSTTERLRLFRTVCSAVEYAHKNLVVHRDLKPANILVTPEGVPKLLDFGIAKLLNPELNEQSVTQTKERMMTPEYASPEQIRGEPITTATDVYALGVLLYELLTGKRPFRLQSKSPFEVYQVVCEQEPEPPSIASRTGPFKLERDLTRKLSGDLDNLVLMAMRKEPARRYASVSALSADVRAYLGGYPVRARTDTWGYRSSKFVRRHKASVAAAVFVTVALVGFSIAMGIMAQRANRARLTAERETQFLSSIFRAATPDKARGKPIMARDLLDQGAKRIDAELAGQPDLQATMLDNIGQAYTSLGLYTEAESLLQQAYTLRRKTSGDQSLETASALDGLATAIRLQEQYQRAEPLFRKALTIREKKLRGDDPLLGESLANLGECLYWEDKVDEAEPLLRRSLAIQRSLEAKDKSDPNNADSARVYLAWVLERKGSYAEAAQLLGEAVDIDKRTKGADSPDYINSLHNYAGALIDSGNLNAAEAADREVLELREKILGPNHPDLFYPLNNLAFISLERGDWAQALPLLQRAYAIRTAMPHPGSSVAVILNNLGRAMQEKGDYAGAERDFNQALALIQKANGRASWSEAKITANLGLMEFDKGDYTAAESYSLQALEMRRTLGGDDNPDVASSLIEVAEVRVFEGDPETAEPMLRKALEIREKKFNPGNPAIIAAQVRLGEALILEGKVDEAETVLRQAVASAHAEPFPLCGWQVAEAESALGAALVAEKRITEGEELLHRSEAELQKHPRPAFRHPVTSRSTLFHSHRA